MLKSAVLYFSLLLCLLLISCDDNEPERLTIMTVVVADGAIPDNEQKWICITDETGNILDEKALSNGQTIELKGTSVPEYVDVTFYSIFSGNYPQHRVSTYKDIPSMKHILIEPGEAGPGLSDPVPLGQATYVIHNFPTLDNESDIYEAVNFNTAVTHYQANVSSTIVNNTYTGVRNIYEDPTDVLVTSFREGERVYLWAQAKPGDEIVLDLQGFELYSHVLTIPDPGSVLSSTSGMNNDGSAFLLSTMSSPGFQDQPTIGYIDGFDYYFTRLNVWKNDRNFSHVKQGERVETLDFPNHSGTVVDNRITSFQYSESEPYSWGVGYWHLPGNDFLWTIHGDVNSQLNVNFIPKAMANFFSDLALSDLAFFRFFLYQRLDGVTFQDHFDQSFGVKAENKFYDFFEVESN